jgi:Arc/MetJ family transcription regulator
LVVDDGSGDLRPANVDAESQIGHGPQVYSFDRRGMVTHMKTTIDIADSLLTEAKRVAAAEGTTLRELVEDGLRRALELRKSKAAPFRLRDASFGGQGLHPDAGDGSWERIRDLIYEGRGA